MSLAFCIGWLRSPLALGLGMAAVPVVNLFGGWLAEVLGLPPGGTARLAWDLGWLAVSGMAMVAIATALAPHHRAAHAGVAGLLLALGLGWALATVAGDFPRWFLASAILSLPMQVWLGWRIGVARRRRRHPRPACDG